jgi:hypothetical protein
MRRSQVGRALNDESEGRSLNPPQSEWRGYGSHSANQLQPTVVSVTAQALVQVWWTTIVPPLHSRNCVGSVALQAPLPSWSNGHASPAETFVTQSHVT